MALLVVHTWTRRGKHFLTSSSYPVVSLLVLAPCLCWTNVYYCTIHTFLLLISFSPPQYFLSSLVPPYCSSLESAVTKGNVGRCNTFFRVVAIRCHPLTFSPSDWVCDHTLSSIQLQGKKWISFERFQPAPCASLEIPLRHTVPYVLWGPP